MGCRVFRQVGSSLIMHKTRVFSQIYSLSQFRANFQVVASYDSIFVPVRIFP